MVMAYVFEWIDHPMQINSRNAEMPIREYWLTKCEVNNNFLIIAVFVFPHVKQLQTFLGLY